MTIIEGVGDEVTEFVVVVLCLAVGVLAWLSTRTRPERDRTRSVLIMERAITVNVPPSFWSEGGVRRRFFTARAIAHRRRNVIIQPSPTPDEASTPLPEAVSADSDGNDTLVPERVETIEQSSSAQIREMDSIVSAMDDDEAVLRHRRTSDRAAGDECSNGEVTPDAGYEVETPPSRGSAASGLNLPRNIQKIICSHNEGDVTPESLDNPPEKSAEEEVERMTPPEEGTDKMTIRLKYLNDTFKEVDGSLEEQLKDFKWRHFGSELRASYRLRLIFRGRVLSDEAASLRALGLHHNAVVHCLLHPPARHHAHAHAHAHGTHPRGASEEAFVAGSLGVLPLAGAEGSEPRPPRPDHSMDLENILMTLVSVALTVVWFFRCQYSNMFTASASVALFGLTVFYSIAIFGLYLSDTFQLDRRQAPPPAPAAAPAPAPTTAPPPHT